MGARGPGVWGSGSMGYGLAMIRSGRILLLALWALGLVLGVAAEVRADATCSVGGAVAEPLEGKTCGGDLTLLGGTTSTLNGDGVLTVTGNLVLQAGATLHVVGATTFATLDVGGDLNLGTNATINLDGASGVTEPSGTGGAGRSSPTTACAGSGAGHGGTGGPTGITGPTYAGGSAYGVPELAFYPGSLGGSGTTSGGVAAFAGGAGGGSVRILVGGLATLDGVLTADGLGGTTSPSFTLQGGSGGGGSGGSIYLKTVDLTTNNPASVHILARGGAGGNGDQIYRCSVAAGGAGGRITVYYSGQNGAAGGSPLAVPTHMRCTGGARGTGIGSSPATAGGVGSCILVQSGGAPQVDSVTPGQIGQGAVNQTLTIAGSGFVPQSQLEIDGAVPGIPSNGVTVQSVAVASPTELTAVVSVDHTADASGGANPKLIRVFNPDLTVSADQFLLTVTPAPTIDHVTQGGATVTGLPRGFAGTIVIHGAGIQADATVTFAAGPITLTSAPAADVGAQTVTVDVAVSTTAAAGPVTFDLTNPDGGTTQVAGSLDVLSLPVITAIDPDTLIVGQTEVPVTVTGSGFIAGAEVVSGSPDVTVESVQFDGFTQLSAVLTVAVEADLATATRTLQVDNGDGGVSPAATLTLEPVPAGLNAADLAYSDGTTTPADRFWNGFGWSAAGTDVGALPEAPEWVVARRGGTAGDLLVATLDPTRRLHLRERVGSTWNALVGPVSLAAGPGRAVDATAVTDAAGERFLAVYGQAGSATLTFRAFGGAGATGAVPASNAACTGGTEVPWVRLVASGAGDTAVLAYAPDNGALCAVTWTAAGGFNVSTEVVLAAPGTLATLATMAFDATFWGLTPPQRGMVAWGIAGSTAPRYAVWNGAWTTGAALEAASSPTETLVGVRLTNSSRSDRVALGDVTDAGELFVQFWGGDRWGATVQGLPFGLVTNPTAMAGAGVGRAFDLAWPATAESVTAIYGLDGDGVPRTRSWTAAGGWSGEDTVPAPAGAQAPAWVQLRANPGGTEFLAGVLDAAGALAYTAWDGVAWGPVRTLGTGAATTGEAFMADWRAAALPAGPAVTDVTYGGVSPASIGAQSTGQTIEVTGTGFLNPPAVTFNSAGITAASVAFVAPTLVRATVTIGAVTPGAYNLTLTNPDGQAATRTGGLVVVAPPASITVRLGSGAPACTPTVGGATACAFQTASGVPVEVLGTGFAAGATVTFEGSGVDFVGPAVLGVDAGTGLQVLSGAVDVSGTATPGAGNVRVTNPDSSTGVGTGIFEARGFTAVASVSPSTLGAGVQDAALTVLGTNFRGGVTFDLGSGVSVGSVALVGTTEAQLVVDVASGAAAGARTVTATNLDGGTGSAVGALSVTAGPTVTSITPAQGNQGTTVSVTVTGTGLTPLAAGTGIAFSGTGIAVSGISASATQVTFDATIAADADFAQPADLTVTRSDGGQVVVAQAFSVVPVPVLAQVTPDTLTAGEIGRVLTITGTGFDPRAEVVIGAGITVHTQSVASSSEIDLTLDVGPGTGSVDLRVANPGGEISAPFTLTVIAPQACVVGAGQSVTYARDGTQPLACTTLSVTGGGTLVLSGDTTLNVLGDADITGATLVPTPQSTYTRLKVGGDLTVGAGGVVDANGTGFHGGRFGAAGEGPGGGQPSTGAFTSNNSGDGGGYGGRGGDGNTGGGGATYDLLGLCTGAACFEGIPLNMGSGGGSAHQLRTTTFPGTPAEDFWRAGGNGGGAVVLEVAGATVIDGTVRASGTDGATNGESILGNTSTVTSGRTSGGGSGGAVLILAHGDLSGAGAILANGGNSPALAGAADTRGTGGGGGRVAVYYGGADTYGGALTCAGGTSPNAAAAFQGAAGTCFAAPLTEITALTPSQVSQGDSVAVTFQGTGLAAGDGVLDPSGGLTWTALAAAGPDFTSAVTAADDTPRGLTDVVVRHADDTGGVAFGAMGVVANPGVFALTPDHLAQGDVAAVQLAGSLLNAAATVTFLRGGVEPQCGGSACVAAVVDAGASTTSILALNVTVSATAPFGGYDVRVQNPDGGTGTGVGAFAVVSTNGSVPALMSIQPNRVGAEVTDFPVALSGYDFGVPGSFAVGTPTTSDPAVTLAFDPAGCPQTPATCVTDPAALQRLDVLVTTVGATPGSQVDVTVAAGALSSTLPGGLTITPRPLITGFTPSAGESTFTLTVSGTDFDSNGVISLENPVATVGATTASGSDLVTTVTVGALVPTSVSSVRVTNPDGGFGILGDLTFNPAPTVTTVGPPSALGVGQSATIVVQGTHFHPNATVSFGTDVTISDVVWLDAGRIQVLATVAASATPGARTVTVTNPNGGSGSLASGFTVSRPVVLTSISPNVVGAGGTHVLLLQGAQISSSIAVGNIAISGTGVTKVGVFNYRAVTVGEVTITSVDLLISVDAAATTSVRTLTVVNPDGSQSSAPFTISPAPVVSFLDPAVVVRNQAVPVNVRINGFNFNTVAPRVCFGAGCDFGTSSSPIHVLQATAVNQSRIDAVLQIDDTTTLGLHPVTVANPDGGTVTKANALDVVVQFTVGALAPNNEVQVGAAGAARTLSGTGFNNAPSAPQVAFLDASGAVDPDITVATAFSSATALDLTISVAGTATPGLRAARVTNGDGSVLEQAGVLLVTNPAGPTIGQVAPATLGLDAAGARSVTGLTVSGSGLDGGGLTLAFNLAGLAVSNVAVAGGGKSATFDLALPAATVPGLAALTATTAAGSDTRAAALRVNAAPVVTTLQPSSLGPGVSNASILIGGGAFQDGAQIEIAPTGAGVTVRDLDTLTAGTQANFLSTTALRTALTTSATAAGTFTLTVVNPDGGRGGAPLAVGVSSQGTSARMAYLVEGTSAGLKVRDFDGVLQAATASNSAALPHVATATDLWTELRANPMVPGEYLLAVGKAQKFTSVASNLALYRTIAAGSTWQIIDAVGALSSTTTQAFDLGYEQTGPGRALMVYGVGTSLLYKTVTSVGASAANPVTVGGAAILGQGAPAWVRLIPEPGGRRILVMYMTQTRQVQALMWDGAAGGGSGAFVSQYNSGGLPLTTNAVVPEASAIGVLKRGFDGAWEGTTGRAVAFYSEDGTNVLQAVTWDPVNDWGTPAASAQDFVGNGPTFVEAEADPHSDRIVVLAQSDNGISRPLVARFYLGGWVAGGTTVTATSTYADSAFSFTHRNFDGAWDDAGNLVLLYDATSNITSGQFFESRLETRTWQPAAGWSVPVEVQFIHHIVAAVEVERDPETGGLLGLVNSDSANALNLSTRFLHWTGGGWGVPTLLSSGGVHWMEVGDPFGTNGYHYGTALALAFREDHVPPTAPALSQTGSTSTTATVQWTAPGDNGAQGQVGGYDFRWSDKTIVDDAAVADCAALPDPATICFSDASQVRPAPAPEAAGTLQSVEVDLGAPGVYTVAAKAGDRANVVDGSGAETLSGNVSALSNVLAVNTLAADAIPPEQVTDLAAADGAAPETMIALTWTGVGDDGDLSTADPVQGYDLRLATLPISEVGGDNNFHVPFDRATRVAVVAPATGAGGTTRGVANAYTVTGLDPGTTYHFAVKGLDEDATEPNAPISNAASHATALVTPTAIDDLVVADVGVNEVTLAWTARDGSPTSYELRFATTPIVTAAEYAAATAVGGLPTPAASGTRQAFTVGGLLPETLYYFALVPVRFQTVGGVLTRLAPDPAVVFATTLADSSGNTTQPSQVTDLAVVTGSVRTIEARLAWTAPGTAGAPAIRYELRWAHRPTATAAPGELHVVPVPMLPGAPGVAQEYTLTGLPENTLVYVTLVAYNGSGFASDPSNEVLLHTALRGGMNAISVPGLVSPNDILTLLGPYAGTCTATGTPTTGSGSVGPCGVGEVTVTAYRFDPGAGTDGDFVAMDPAELLEPGAGVFLQAAGTRAVLAVAGLDQTSFAPVALAANPTLVSNPYVLPVAVADLRVVGDDGYDAAFADAVADGVIDPVLRFFTREDGVLKYVDVTDADDLLPYRAYFTQLGPLANPAVAYSLEVPHP